MYGYAHQVPATQAPMPRPGQAQPIPPRTQGTAMRAPPSTNSRVGQWSPPSTNFQASQQPATGAQPTPQQSGPFMGGGTASYGQQQAAPPQGRQAYEQAWQNPGARAAIQQWHDSRRFNPMDQQRQESQASYRRLQDYGLERGIAEEEMRIERDANLRYWNEMRGQSLSNEERADLERHYKLWQKRQQLQESRFRQEWDQMRPAGW